MDKTQFMNPDLVRMHREIKQELTDAGFGSFEQFSNEYARRRWKFHENIIMAQGSRHEKLKLEETIDLDESEYEILD